MGRGIFIALVAMPNAVVDEVKIRSHELKENILFITRSSIENKPGTTSRVK